jgi:hypothetical protein
MNPKKLIGTLPPPANFKGESNAFRQQAAENFISAILVEIALEKREPDAWEAHDIAAAIGFLAAGQYYASIACATRALTMPEDRSRLPLDLTEPMTIWHLRAALDHAAALPPLTQDAVVNPIGHQSG